MIETKIDKILYYLVFTLTAGMTFILILMHLSLAFSDSKIATGTVLAMSIFQLLILFKRPNCVPFHELLKDVRSRLDNDKYNKIVKSRNLRIFYKKVNSILKIGFIFLSSIIILIVNVYLETSQVDNNYYILKINLFVMLFVTLLSGFMVIRYVTQISNMFKQV